MKKTVKFLFLLMGFSVLAQTGTIRGVVKDKQSEMSLMGASVQLLDDATKGTLTDEDGFFALENIPVGRHALKISFIGYESFTLPTIEVTSGKDVSLNIHLQEAFESLEGVVLVAKKNKAKALNQMASISARQFSVDEVTRFSGGRSDVGRLAANFAGVSSPDDSRNDIVVRGNSPTGLLWRLEGIPIPSPNHYSTTGTTGGPVSALNSNMLRSSDFLTSAFPSEYGNALGGVFDLGLRKGNKDKYEFTGQIGAFTGLEAMAEGPFGKNKGSFLVAARYSLVGLLGVGAGGTSATPNYKDLSFNIDFGKSKFGNFQLFGILADSDITFLGDEINEDDLFAATDEDSFVTSGFGVIGIKHQINLTESTFLRTIVANTYNKNTFIADRAVDMSDLDNKIRYSDFNDKETRYTLSTLVNSKLSKKVTLRAGVVVENYKIRLVNKDRYEQDDTNGDGNPDLFTYRDTDEDVYITQPFIQSRIRLTEHLTLNTGIHAQHSSLSNQFVVEPRVGANYKLGRHQFSAGYGLHHQPIALPLLLVNEDVDGELVQTNKDLDFVRSHHYVLGYDVRLRNSWRAKLELYYQSIQKAGVEQNSSSYSTLTEGTGFGFSGDRTSLVSEGTGTNKGVEITVEKFFTKGYYALFTASFFESKYKGSDGIERNTPFNNQRVLNLLGGKEFKIGKDGRKILFADTKVTYAGGRFYTPIDLAASQAAGFEQTIDDEAFSLQNKDYFRWDLKFGMKLNSKTKKQSHQFYFDLQNVTANENIFARRYNRITNEVNQVNQIGFFPDVGYKFQF
ncbi:TonB-dependent receptor [Wenyingzhuangia sp. IMCC45574]